MTYINFFLVKRPRILPKALYFESPSSPRAFDYGPGPTMISNGNFCPVAVFNGAQIALLKNDPTFFENFQKNFFSIFL